MRVVLGLALVLAVTVPSSELRAGEEAALDDATFFRTRVRPILSDKCFKCHGPGVQEADMRLDQREAALSAGLIIPVIVPGKPEESELINRVSTDDIFTRMPPSDVSKKLSEEQIGILREWIERGAPYAPHWAYERDATVEIPTPETTGWARNEIDAFILTKLEEAALTPAPEADRETLIRRVSLDLTGILPTPAEVEAFVNDPRPDAYDRLVDRLLASPHYGERQGRHWLDLARYADSNGYTIDSARTMWPYRDWVIRAINNNMPFDQFTIEQLAGDMLEEPTKSQLIATGFQRNTPFNEEGGTDPEQFRVERTLDRANTIGSVWLGLTMACAQCHDHKFDAISQKEYYQLYAFFNSVKEDKLAVPRADREERIARLHQEIEEFKNHPPALLEGSVATKFAKDPAAMLGGGWATLTPRDVEAKQGSTLKVLEDSSVLASGEAPTADTYRVQVTLPAGKLTAMRLEALTHESLPKQGPGRASNGNFVLREFSITIDGETVPLSKALADHSQEGYDVGLAIDGDAQKGWAISTTSGNQNVDRSAVFLPEKPLDLKEETPATVTLVFQEKSRCYTLGRFRLAVTDAASEVVSLPVSAQSRLLALAGAGDAEALTEGLQQAEAALREAKIEEIKQEIAGVRSETVSTLILRQREEPRPTHVFDRGSFLSPAEPVEPGTLAVLPELETEDERATRLDLARWLVSDDHPLTPRVVVNRYWQRFFGVGIVETEADFGMQGAFPTHPKLLDWLAAEFVASGWDVKHMHKLIVTSAAYRQSSHWRDDAFEKDARNKLLARQNRIRLDAEILRDAALAASGKLVHDVGGPGVYPPQPAEVFSFTQAKREWSTDKYGDRYRRGIYTFIWRQSQHPLLTTFDGPDAQASCTRRNRSNTPLQALHLANDKVFFELAQALGQRVAGADLSSDGERIAYAFELCMAREPSSREREALLALLKQQRERYPETAWTMVARTLLNLDEFVTRE